MAAAGGEAAAAEGGAAGAAAAAGATWPAGAAATMLEGATPHRWSIEARHLKHHLLCRMDVRDGSLPDAIHIRAAEHRSRKGNASHREAESRTH